MADTLGAFASAFRYEDLPAAEQERVRMHLLYLIGTVFASRAHEGNRVALEMADRRQQAGPSSFWLSGAKGTAEDCAFVNGILSHTGLLDDMPVHTGAIVIPAALAVAEAEGRTGAETLAAIALGYEVVLRLDKPLSDGHMLGHLVHAKGFRHSWFAVFGAAVAAGYLHHLTAEGIADTMALTTTLCVPGAMAWAENRLGPAAVKRAGTLGVSERYLQMAINAKQAVFAAELVKSGFKGSDTAIEGQAGLYAVYAGNTEVPAELTQDLGRVWHLDEVGVKAYPGAGYTTPTYCAERLARDHAPSPDEIARIAVRTTPWGGMVGMVDRGPFTNIEQALTSCPFAVAATLVFGRFDWDVVQQALGHAGVDALAERVEVTANGPVTEIEVSLKGGKTLTANDSDMPTAKQKLTEWKTTVTRFDQLTATSLPTRQRDQIVEEVLKLDERPDCRALIALLTT